MPPRFARVNGQVVNARDGAILRRRAWKADSDPEPVEMVAEGPVAGQGILAPVVRRRDGPVRMAIARTVQAVNLTPTPSAVNPATHYEMGGGDLAKALNRLGPVKLSKPKKRVNNLVMKMPK